MGANEIAEIVDYVVEAIEADRLNHQALIVDRSQIVAKLNRLASKPLDLATLNEGVQDRRTLDQHARALAQAVAPTKIGPDSVNQLEGPLGGGRAPVQAIEGEQLHLPVGTPQIARAVALP